MVRIRELCWCLLSTAMIAAAGSPEPPLMPFTDEMRVNATTVFVSGMSMSAPSATPSADVNSGSGGGIDMDSEIATSTESARVTPSPTPEPTVSPTPPCIVMDRYEIFLTVETTVQILAGRGQELQANLIGSIVRLWGNRFVPATVEIEHPLLAGNVGSVTFEFVRFSVCFEQSARQLSAREQYQTLKDEIMNGAAYNLTVDIEVVLLVKDINLVAVSTTEVPSPSPTFLSRSPSSPTSSPPSRSPSPSLTPSPPKQVGYTMGFADPVTLDGTLESVTVLMKIGISELLDVNRISPSEICCIQFEFNGNRLRRAIMFDVVLFSVLVSSSVEEGAVSMAVMDIQNKVARGESVELNIGNTKVSVTGITPEGPSPPDDEDDDDDDGLSAGAIAGIVIAVLFVVLICLVVILALGYFFRRRHSKTYEFEMMSQAKTVKTKEAESAPVQEYSKTDLEAPQGYIEGDTETGPEEPKDTEL